MGNHLFELALRTSETSGEFFYLGPSASIRAVHAYHFNLSSDLNLFTNLSQMVCWTA